MHTFSLVLVWLIFISSWFQKHYTSTSLPTREPDDMKEFFDHIEKVMDQLMVEPESEDTAHKSDIRKLRYLMPETVARERERENIYSRGNNLQVVNSLPSSRNNPFYISNDMDGRNTVVDFERYQKFIFRPLYCDSYDSAQRYCILRQQLGTTLTLGVQVGEGLNRGMQIYWYRCLRRKNFDHIIKEPLNKGSLPWNLNLGGSSNELRISPISEIDLSYNYFIAELATPRLYKGNSQKTSIRFYIESIEIDMGSLYPGEEIVIYVRSFMELPRTSVNFLWSMQAENDLEDHDLPSNMQLNADRSSVIIKELKTYQDQYLVCKVFSNKDFLLAKRTFLFRGFGRNKTNVTSNNIRFKRYAEDTEQPYRESNQMQYEETEDQSKIAEKDHDSFSDPEINFREVPEIATDLFYNIEKYPHKPRDSNYKPLNSQNAISRIMRSFLQKEESPIKKPYRTTELPRFEKPRFEDIESQMIATCGRNSDCNIRATCVRKSNYEQNFCQCSRGFNGNGLFCLRS